MILDRKVLKDEIKKMIDEGSEKLFVLGFSTLSCLNDLELDNIKINILVHSYDNKYRNIIKSLNKRDNITVKISTKAVHNFIVNKKKLIFLSTNSKKDTAAFITNNETEAMKAYTLSENLWKNGYNLYFEMGNKT
ncbi:MAG: hypothetical protein U5K53_08050 [Halanaerobiales bacterium]|nr:hypothetical protein [Halanaerobiales bacterium]